MSELRMSYDASNYSEERITPKDLDALVKRLAAMEARLTRLEKLVEVEP